MVPVASFLLSLAIGCLLLYRFGRLSAFRPRWSGWLLIFGGGTALGIAITSCLFFVFILIFPGLPQFTLWLQVVLLAVAAVACRRFQPAEAPPDSHARFPNTYLLWIAFLVALLVVSYGMSTAWEATPHGNWDAWSIWNVRAKFLAAGDGVAARAWSPELSATHPEYPLLLSGFIASCWAAGGDTTPAVPIAASYVFFLALLSMVTGGVAALRGSAIGLLAGGCLMGMPVLLHEATSQYADIPLACYFAGAVLFVLLDRPLIAGALAGCAAWTKDEGLLFLAVIAMAVLLWKRAKSRQFWIGLAPFAAVVALFKLGLARGVHSQFTGPATAHHLTDFSRYRAIVAAMFDEALAWHTGWYHPLLPVVILLIALRIDRQHLRQTAFCAAIALAMLCGYFGVYLVTPNDLKWQLDTSLTRVFVQAVPLLLITAFVAMREPQEAPAATPAPRKADPRRKAKRHAR